MYFKCIILVTYFITFSYSANILAVMPTPSYSHQIAFTPLWRELSLRGHNVTVITTDPVRDPKLVNLTEIDIKWSYSFFANISKMAEQMSMWNMQESFLEICLILLEKQLSYSPIQGLIQNRGHFDVVLVEHIFPELLGFAELYDCPKILIGSFDTYAHIHQAMGNPSHPVLYPELGTPFHGSLNLKERIIATLFSWYTELFFVYKGYPERQKIFHKYFNTTTSLREILYDIDLMLLNVNPLIQGVRAVGPTTINIGAFRQTTSSKPLPKDLKEFLDNATNGFIYFSLGSNVKSKELSGDMLKTITETLSELPYQVLWKFEADDLPGKPNNVKLIKWAPQQNILAHPNIKLFVTQGGLQSMEEGISSGVPFVVIPFFGDQDQNAQLMKNKGIAKIVQRKPTLNKMELKSAILEVINNPRYRNSVKKLKQLILDTPMTGLEKAVWWTEYVIRNKGAKHLRNPTADIPFYQYYLLDVIGSLILVCALIIAFLFLLVKKIFRLLLSNFPNDYILKFKKVQ